MAELNKKHLKFIEEFYKRFDQKKVDFNFEAHTYTIDGIKYNSVSDIIKPLTTAGMSLIPKEFLERSAAFGQFIHDLTDKIDRGELDFQEERRKLDPYKQSWQIKHLDTYYDLLRKNGLQIILSEVMVWNEELRIAGTIDKIVYNNRTHMYHIIDLKTGSIQPTHEYQLDFYNKLLTKKFELVHGGKDLVEKSIKLDHDFDDFGYLIYTKFNTVKDSYFSKNDMKLHNMILELISKR